MKWHLIEDLRLQGLTGSFFGAADGDIVELEEQVGFRLPEVYKNFLKTYGASLFAEDVGFRSLEPSPWVDNGLESFDGFYGISKDPGFDLRSINHRLRKNIPIQTIVIGHDPGSNLILISANGEVLFLDRDSGKTFLVAKNFESFVNSFELRNRP